jgi:hypothetical protein
MLPACTHKQSDAGMKLTKRVRGNWAVPNVTPAPAIKPTAVRSAALQNNDSAYRIQQWKSHITWLLSPCSIIHGNAFTQFPNSVLPAALDQCRLYVRIHLKVKDTFSGLWPMLHSDMTSTFTFIKAGLSQLHMRPFVGNLSVQRTGRFLVLREERAFSDKRNNRTKKRVLNSRPFSPVNLPQIGRQAEITASW